MPISELLAIAVALPHESKAILPHLKVQATTRFQKSVLYEGDLGAQPCVLLQTGMGAEHAQQGAAYLVQHYPVRRILVTGYCGGLVPGVQTGDGILAEEVISEKDGARLVCAESWRREVLNQLQSKSISTHGGALIQVERPAASPEAKKKLAEGFRATGVDMESFSVLKIAQERQNITSLALRFVVDPVGVDLAETEAFVDSAGHFQAVPFLKQALRRPGIFLKLPGLERMASKAHRQLAKSIEVIFDL
jgi:adenosylhomocysteine nucleosidase